MKPSMPGTRFESLPFPQVVLSAEEVQTCRNGVGCGVIRKPYRSGLLRCDSQGFLVCQFIVTVGAKCTVPSA